MRHKRVKLSAVLLLGVGLTGIQAQSTTTTSGGDASGSGGTANYTIGQIGYTTYAGTNGSAAQGVQQPYEISIVTALKESKGVNLICNTFPNPVTEYIKLNVENKGLQNLSYQLFDAQGKRLINQTIIGAETSISMGDFSTGSYFLKVTDNKLEVITFKIIKN